MDTDLKAARALPAIMMTLALLTACGGGSGSRPTPAPDPSGPPPPPPPPPPPVLVEPPDPEYSQHLIRTGADLAHADGLSGAGIRIGIIDSGIQREHPALRGRVLANLVYVNANRNNLGVDDVLKHGTAVAQTAAGAAFGRWPGGIAPGAELLSARIIADTPPEDDGSGRGNEVNPGPGGLGLEPIHRDLIQRGMRIMNNSWGGLYWTNPAATNAIAAEYRDFIHHHDGLVVFSTGNEGLADPSDTAALPSQPGPGNTRPAADLARGWLAVAALDNDDPTQLADYSNACGVAMDYCLVAPGTVIVTDADDPPDAPSYWRWRGTSFAAPIVSGAAALVWEAFPYFDNDQVRQTLLGTATDLGEAGVDPVFGHGAINIARAVKGPSRLDWGDLWVGFDGGTSVFGNDLSGDGALIKDGNGTLILQGRLRNRDGVFVDAGTVQALQTIDGDVDVAAQANLLLGNGVRGGDIGGTLDNAGRVEVWGYGSTVNTTRIGGNYLHQAGATLALELGQRFAVQGAAVIAGGDLHVLGVKPGYTPSAREEVLVANAGVEGRFGELTYANTLFLNGQLDYDPNRVWLDIIRLNVTSVAQTLHGITAQALSGAARMEQAFTALDAAAAQGPLADAAFLRGAGQFQQLRDPAHAVAALESLSGHTHAQALSLAFDHLDLGRRATAARVAGWEPGVPGAAWKADLGHGGAGGMPGGGWVQQGWMIGQERALGEAGLAGFAFFESEARFTSGGLAHERSHARQTQAQWSLARMETEHYVLAQFGLGRSQRHTQRHPFAGADGRDATSVSNSRYGSLALEAGRKASWGRVALAPYLGLEHGWLDTDGFEETGAAGFGLRVAAARIQRTQALAGIRADTRWRGLNISARAEWLKVLSASGFEVMASFTGMDSWSPLPLAAAARSGGVFGLDLAAPLSARARLSLNIDQRFGPRGDERIAMVRYMQGF